MHRYIFATLFAITVLASLYERLLGDDADESKTTHEEKRQVSIDINGNSADRSTKKSTLSLPSRLILCFSLVRNTREMFQVKPNKFNSVDCLRFVMLLEIILMHQYYVALGWAAWPLSKRFVSGLFQKVGTDFKYGFLRNIHNTDFFFSLR